MLRGAFTSHSQTDSKNDNDDQDGAEDTDATVTVAAECRRMAIITRNQASKATWAGLAERWVLCADLAERQSFSASVGGLNASQIRDRAAQSRLLH